MHCSIVTRLNENCWWIRSNEQYMHSRPEVISLFWYSTVIHQYFCCLSCIYNKVKLVHNMLWGYRQLYYEYKLQLNINPLWQENFALISAWSNKHANSGFTFIHPSGYLTQKAKNKLLLVRWLCLYNWITKKLFKSFAWISCTLMMKECSSKLQLQPGKIAFSVKAKYRPISAVLLIVVKNLYNSMLDNFRVQFDEEKPTNQPGSSVYLKWSKKDRPYWNTSFHSFDKNTIWQKISALHAIPGREAEVIVSVYYPKITFQHAIRFFS